MSKLKNFIMNYDNLSEAPYHGNLGFSELVEFYQQADRTEINRLERVIKDEDWEGFKYLIQKVLGVKLK